MNHISFGSSPIRNLEASQATKSQYEDQFFQIRCTRLQKDRLQLEEEVCLLSKKLVEAVTDSQDTLIIASQLKQQNSILRWDLEQLSRRSLETGSRALELRQSRERAELLKEVDDLMNLYDTVKAQTALFRAENDRLRNEELTSRYSSKKNKAEEQLLQSIIEIGLLKKHIDALQNEGVQAKIELQNQRTEIQRLNTILSKQREPKQESFKDQKIADSRIQVIRAQARQSNYYSVQETPIKNVFREVQDLSNLEEQIISLKAKCEHQKDLHQILLSKYQDLSTQNQRLVRDKKQTGLRVVTEQSVMRESRPSDNLLLEASRTDTKNVKQDLKSSKLSREVQRMQRLLSEKQEEIKNILTRFAPLLKIQAGQISLEEDRKQRIDKHWKADIAILDVLLSKYRIQVFN